MMRERGRNFVYPLITFVVLLIIWIGYLRIFDVPDYILPEPSSVWNAFVNAYSEGFIYPHLLFTMKSMVIGYLIGSGVGLVLGGIVAESPIFERFVYPYVVILHSTPKVALAPLIIVWFGFGIESKIVMVVLICFFPVFINTVVGIRQTDRDLIEVLRACSASRLHIFFHVKVPSAAGAIFAGLQISVVLGLIGAIVAEFVASTKGLGTVLQAAALDLNTSLMLTAVFTLATLGLIGNLLVRFVQRKVVFWEAQDEKLTSNMEAS